MHIILFAIILLVISLFLSKIIYKNYFSPLGLYACLWSSMIVVYNSGIFYYPDLSMQTLLLVFGSYSSFIAGCVFFWLVLLKSNNLKKSQLNYCNLNISYYRNILKVVSFLGLVTTIMYFVVVVSNVGVDAFLGQFSEKSVMLRKAMIDDANSVGRTGMITTIPLMFIYSATAIAGGFVALDKKYSKYAYIVFVSVLIYSLAEMSRARILDFIVILGFSYTLFYSNNLNLCKQVIFSIKNILIISIFFIAIVLIGEAMNKNSGELELATIELPAVITHGFYRLTIGLQQFDNLTQLYGNPMLLGDATFNVLYRLGDLIGIVDNYNRVLFYEVNTVSGWKGYNTPTYLMWFYMDYGRIGVILFPFLLGIILSYSYLRMMRKPRIEYIALNSLLMLSIFVSFGTWRFWDLYYIGGILLLLIIDLFRRIRFSL